MSSVIRNKPREPLTAECRHHRPYSGNSAVFVSRLRTGIVSTTEYRMLAWYRASTAGRGPRQATDHGRLDLCGRRKVTPLTRLLELVRTDNRTRKTDIGETTTDSSLITRLFPGYCLCRQHRWHEPGPAVGSSPPSPRWRSPGVRPAPPTGDRRRRSRRSRQEPTGRGSRRTRPPPRPRRPRRPPPRPRRHRQTHTTRPRAVTR